MDPNSIRERLGKRIEGKNQTKNLIHIHHLLMKEYGWIPLEEFKKLPMFTIMDLAKMIEEENKAKAKAMKPKKSGRGMWSRRHV